MVGSHTSIVRRTKQNAATLGVILVVLEPLLGPLWPWVCDMPILDLDEVGENKKPFYLRISSWEGQILPLALNLIFYLHQNDVFHGNQCLA